MKPVAKITPDDYPYLLAALDAGVSERKVARRFRCAPSLVHRHKVKARQLRELEAKEKEVGTDLSAEPIKGSMREILEARIRDTNTPGRELTGLVNALGRLGKEEELNRSSGLPFLFRSGTLIFEPTGRGPESERRYRLLVRKRGGIKQVADDLLAAEAVYCFGLMLRNDLGLPLEAFGLTSEDGVVVARPD